MEEKRCMLLMEVGGPNVQFSQIYLLNTAAILCVWYNRGEEYNTNVLIPSGFYIFELVLTVSQAIYFPTRIRIWVISFSLI